MGCVRPTHARRKTGPLRAPCFKSQSPPPHRFSVPVSTVQLFPWRFIFDSYRHSTFYLFLFFHEIRTVLSWGCVCGGQVVYVPYPPPKGGLMSIPEKYSTVRLCMSRKKNRCNWSEITNERELSMGEFGSFGDEWDVQRFFYSYRKKNLGSGVHF